MMDMRADAKSQIRQGQPSTPGGLSYFVPLPWCTLAFVLSQCINLAALKYSVLIVSPTSTMTV